MGIVFFFLGFDGAVDCGDADICCDAVVEASAAQCARDGNDECGGVLISASEEGDSTSHEDEAEEDSAMGHQEEGRHPLPTSSCSPSRLDSCLLRG